MSERFNQLTSKHRALQTRSAMQRRALGAIASEIETNLSGVDRGVNAVRGFVRHPAVLVGVLGAVAVIGPRRLVGYLSRGALLWATARNLLRATRP